MKAIHRLALLPLWCLLMAGTCGPTGEGEGSPLDPCVVAGTCGAAAPGVDVDGDGDLVDRGDIVDDGLADPPTVRGVYLDGLDRTLASATATDALLGWLRREGFTGISCYDLGAIFDDPALTDALTRFIARARREAGVVDVAAVRDSAAAFAAVVDYNRRVAAEARFDVFTLEHEWWNGAGTFREHARHLEGMAALAGADVVVDDYIGWFHNAGDDDGDGLVDLDAADMAAMLVARTDRIMVHAYRDAPDLAFLAARLRLLSAAAVAAGRDVEVIVIFSAEDAFMGPWFQARPFDEAWAVLQRQLDDADPALTRRLRLVGTWLFAASHARRARP